MSEPEMAALWALALLNLIALGLFVRPRIARKREEATKARREEVSDTSADQLLALVEEIECAERSRARPSRGESRLAEDLERWRAAGGDDLFLPQPADSCRSTTPKSASGRVA